MRRYLSKFIAFTLCLFAAQVDAGIRLIQSYTVGTSANYQSPSASGPVINESNELAVRILLVNRFQPGLVLTSLYFADSSGRTLIESATSSIGPTLPGFGINNLGQVGYLSRNPSTAVQTVRRWTSGSIENLATFTGTVQSQRQLINDDGDIFVRPSSPANFYRVDNSGAHIVALSTLPDIAAISSSDYILGYVPGQLLMADIGSSLMQVISTGVTPATGDLTRALNELGQVAFVSNLNDLYTTSLSTLPSLRYDTPSGTFINAVSINDDGAIVLGIGSTSSTISSVKLLLPGETTPTTILSVGDSFLGGTVSALTLSTDAINNNNYMTLGFTLNNTFNTAFQAGAAIFAVPETGSILLVGLAGLFATAGMALRKLKSSRE